MIRFHSEGYAGSSLDTCALMVKDGVTPGDFFLHHVTIYKPLNLKIILGDIVINWDTVFYSVYI